MRDRVPRTARLVAAAALLVAGAGGAAAAEPELEPLSGGASVCPRPELVLAELATLLPPDRLTTRLRALTGTPAVELIDLGVPFQVVVGSKVREYRDEARDCTQRARVAAVFVAMTIDPASIAAPPAPPPPPAAVETTAPPPLRPRGDVAAAVDAGIASERVAQAGLDLRVTIGRRSIAFAAGAILLWPVDTTIGGVRLRQLRVPIDAGVRFQLVERRFAPYAELGLSAALLKERALDLAAANNQTTVELGVRGAVGVRLGRSGYAPFAALRAELVPSPPEIYALPQGVAGHTPHLWIGASAGFSVGSL